MNAGGEGVGANTNGSTNRNLVDSISSVFSFVLKDFYLTYWEKSGNILLCERRCFSGVLNRVLFYSAKAFCRTGNKRKTKNTI